MRNPKLKSFVLRCTSLAILLACGIGPAAAANRAGCTAGVSTPSDLPDIRPTPSAACAYDYDEFVSRALHFAVDQSTPLTVENVERAFDFPQMTTAHDDPHAVWYPILVSGTGGWRAYVNVNEDFYPLRTGPAHYGPGPRPERLFEYRDVRLTISLRVDISLIRSYPVLQPNQCFRTAALLSAFASAGWTNISAVQPPVTDGGKNSYVFAYNDKRVVFGPDDAPCVQSIMIRQDEQSRVDNNRSLQFIAPPKPRSAK